MTVAGGAPVEARVEWGLCVGCRQWRRGRFLRDLTAHTAEVAHCQPHESPDGTNVAADRLECEGR